ncbi:DamX protein [Gilliamella bombicola]|uniref:DamX protein n=1 Tax=Gilliamella bombicola TaxID=1798182 RepID=A0A1C3Z0A0_9GAMM|nr:SPOR domain-containing protein [Gilliamella bombicola]SCB75739.1 DamX protein [Gilliamella bombicola]
MRVDREDRYISEQPNKGAILSSKLPKLLQDCFKKKRILLGLAVVIILLLVSLVLFRSSNKNEPTPLTPPEINGVEGSQVPSDSVTHGQDEMPMNPEQTNSEQNAEPNTQGNKQSSEIPNDVNHNLNSNGNPKDRPEVPTNPVIPPSNTNGVENSNNIKANPAKTRENKGNINGKTSHHKPDKNVTTTNNLKLKDNSYSIQLTASKSADGLKKFINQHKITNYQVYETKRNNEKWYILIKGNYSSSEEAHKAIKSLPSALQKDKPWVKSGATINKEKAAK